MYRLLAIVVAIICAGLGVVFALAGESYLALYGVPGNPASDFLALRAAPLFFGLAALLWMTRDAPPSRMRRAICTAFAIMWVGVAFTGLYEYGRGFATVSIAVAALIEMAMAAAFLVAARR